MVETKNSGDTHQLYSVQIAVLPDPNARFHPDLIRHGRCAKVLGQKNKRIRENTYAASTKPIP